MDPVTPAEEEDVQTASEPKKVETPEEPTAKRAKTDTASESDEDNESDKEEAESPTKPVTRGRKGVDYTETRLKSENKRVEVYPLVPEKCASDESYKCIEDEQKCVVIRQCYTFLLRGYNDAFEKITRLMQRSAYQFDAMTEFNKNRYIARLKVEYPELPFDGRMVMLMTLPIRYAKGNAANLSAVITGYKVKKFVPVALEDCEDITETLFPNLYRVKVEGDKKNKTLARINSRPNNKILVFLVRLHYAVLVFNTIIKDKTQEEMKFDFETFPQLEDVLSELEAELADKQDRPVATKRKLRFQGDSTELGKIILNCREKLNSLDKIAHVINGKMEEMNKQLEVIGKCLEEAASVISEAESHVTKVVFDESFETTFQTMMAEQLKAFAVQQQEALAESKKK